MGKLNSLMQTMFYTCYWLPFFKNDNLKYAATSQRRSFNSFSFFYIFSLIVFFVVISFQTVMHKKNIFNLYVCNLFRISYTLSFCYVMYYIVSEICISRRFLEDCFCFYSRQITSAVAIKFLIPYNLIKRAP